MGKQYIGPRLVKGPKVPSLAKDALKSKLGKGYQKVQGWQRLPKGPSLAKGILIAMVGNRYLKIQDWQRAPKGSRLVKGTEWSNPEVQP